MLLFACMAFYAGVWMNSGEWGKVVMKPDALSDANKW